ncbi:MAG: hypothetical protein JST75_20535 [Bacteroidetes bacterium]|nr:hypothetical protein [Bacteroidota bacterium]
MTNNLLILLVFLLTYTLCYGQNDNVVHQDTTMWLTPKGVNVSTFLQKVNNAKHHESEVNILVMTNDFFDTWVKPSDIDKLIRLVKSKVKCDCFVSPLSSTIPFKDSADLGGYAIAFIKAYKEKKKVNFGLYACPKTNNKDADELIKWWTQQKYNGSRQHWVWHNTGDRISRINICNSIEHL